LRGRLMRFVDIDALFIDDGDVLNDNAIRGPQFRRLVAEFFAPRLGGGRIAWEEANRSVADTFLFQQVFASGSEAEDYASWWGGYQVQWLRRMAAIVGAYLPDRDTECLRLACEAIDYITPRIMSEYPGAAEAVSDLHRMGFSLFTASGEHSRELDGYLRGMGIRQHFEVLYGPDLVNAAKYSVEYYRRIFVHAGIAPRRALVVDDKLRHLAWASELGARTCLVGAPGQSLKIDLVVSALADLPSLVGEKR
jgi:HAD superfamily hydrolase (TIGR01509 family)